MRRTTIAGTAAAAVCALAAPAALAAGMHPVLGAKLTGMGDHGVVNLQSSIPKHQLCWTFDVMADHVTGASIRDGHGMITTLRHQLIRMPTRLVRHAGTLIPRMPPRRTARQVLARIRALPARY